MDKEIQNRAKQSMLYEQVLEELSKCGDMQIREFFDIKSMKDLGQKLKVLKKLNNGEDVSEEEYYGIMELKSKDKGTVEIV